MSTIARAPAPFKDDPMEAVFALDDQALKELHIQRELMECPPWNTPPRKLQAAFEGIVAGKVAYNQLTARWQVIGSKDVPYEVTRDGCSCPNGQHTQKTRYNCWHATAAELYDRWRKALGQPVGSGEIASREDAMPSMAEKRRITQHFVDTMETPMPVPTPPPDAAYIPEPAVLTPEVVSGSGFLVPGSQPATRDDKPETREPATTTALAPAPTRSLEAQDLEARLTAWSEQRKVLTRFIKQHLVEGSDYGKIHIKRDCNNKYRCSDPYHFSKDCLFKAGSEKFLGLLRLKPTFRKDDETWEMLGRPPGVLCLICTLLTVNGEIVGEGRGIRDVQKDQGDYNKAVKLAQKSSQLDAILRTGCLSDVFTQDLDSDEGTVPEKTAPVTPPINGTGSTPTIEQLRDQIAALLKQLGVQAVTREDYEQAVEARTNLKLARENYGEIVDRLSVLVAAR
jgi:hypothetical protein